MGSTIIRKKDWLQFGTTTRAFERVCKENLHDSQTPGKFVDEFSSMLGTDFWVKVVPGNLRLVSTFAGIETIVANHLEMLFGNMKDELFDKIHNRDRLRNSLMIFMPGVMESNRGTVIGINARRSDRRTPEITANILDYCLSASMDFRGVDIETIRMSFVDQGRKL